MLGNAEGSPVQYAPQDLGNENASTMDLNFKI